MKSSSKVVEDGVFDLVDALKSPVLTHAQSWADCIPDRLIKIIPMARMKSLILHEKYASLAETCAFIMTRSFEAPMQSEWVNIYTWLGCKVCEEWWNEDHWKDGISTESLTDYEVKQYLNPLRLWIYERRRKILKQRLKDEPKSTSIKLEDIDEPVVLDIFEVKQLTLDL
jgi:hypothetical protein